MSRRANGTNRAAALCGGSKYTGYAKPRKKAASLTELNGHLTKKLQLITRVTFFMESLQHV